MKVIVAEKCGFCPGVRNAISMAEKILAEEKDVYSLGPIIHNRDVVERLAKAGLKTVDTIETFRDMVSGMLDTYLSSISNRMNAAMKVLTIIATIFIPLTFVAGIYGMNFENMPELKWRFGYAAVLAFMAVVFVLMLFYFKKKKWL